MIATAVFLCSQTTPATHMGSRSLFLVGLLTYACGGVLLRPYPAFSGFPNDWLSPTDTDSALTAAVTVRDSHPVPLSSFRTVQLKQEATETTKIPIQF